MLRYTDNAQKLIFVNIFQNFCFTTLKYVRIKVLVKFFFEKDEFFPKFFGRKTRYVAKGHHAVESNLYYNYRKMRFCEEKTLKIHLIHNNSNVFQQAFWVIVHGFFEKIEF